jgi:hypothetical protein
MIFSQLTHLRQRVPQMPNYRNEAELAAHALPWRRC